LWISDEATAHLDRKGEEAFFQALDLMDPLKTVLIITHHLNILPHVDRVYVLQRGRIWGGGNPRELQGSPLLRPYLEAYGGRT